MTEFRRHSRVLIYSHDSFGLGHLRRCRAIAHSLVADDPLVTVLILSGSPIIGNFGFRHRVDFVRVPGVIKLTNGEYTSESLSLDIDQTVAMRASIINHTAETFDPDLFIVDKEPLGLRSEVHETLHMLRDRGTPLVLGLRDIMDEPSLLAPEWERKNVVPALRDLYDEIWVYGLSQICDPLADIALPPSVRRKMIYTGYLRREATDDAPASPTPVPFEQPYLLVTPGGGGDGEGLIDWVLRAYESDQPPHLPALFVFGPFMSADSQARFMDRAMRLDQVAATTFDANIERIMSKAVGVVAMGGYNTFCEILSFDKPAIIVPRTRPRMEQYIRAKRAQDLGLIKMLVDDGVRDAQVMATALRHLPQQGRPSDVVVPGLLDGLDNVNRMVARIRETRETPRFAMASHGG